MCKTEKDLVGQIYKPCEHVRCLKSIVIHYIIHQQGVFRKYLSPS